MRASARNQWIVLVAFLAAAAPRSLTGQESIKSEAAFKQLRSLVGDWQGVYEGTPIKVRYSVTADGSALMLEEQPGDSTAMVTMFTVDGDHLIATHYCSARNQPQMVTSDPGNLDKGITFSLLRVTGLKTPEDWHNTGLTVRQEDPDHLTHQWSYLYKGSSGTRVFRFTRVK
jgi:hypothetical protein